MLLNLTLSEQLIKVWIKKVRPQLECENPDRKHFEKTLKELSDSPEDLSKDKMFLHEFLYLMQNAQDRFGVLSSVKRQKLSITKIDIGSHDGIANYDGPKLDKLYDFDLNSLKINQNPMLLMQT